MASQSEHTEQCQVIAWARNSGDWRLRWLHAIPNGLTLNKGQRIKAVKEGLTRGVADLFLPYPAKGYAGLYLEMKTRTGRLSGVQEEFREYAEKVGYKYEVPRSGIEAIEMMIEYLKGDKK